MSKRYFYVEIISDRDPWVGTSGAVIGQVYKAERTSSGGTIVHVEEDANHYYIQDDCIKVVPKPPRFGENIGWETP